MRQFILDPKKTQYMVDGAENGTLSALMHKLSIRMQDEI